MPLLHSLDHKRRPSSSRLSSLQSVRLSGSVGRSDMEKNITAPDIPFSRPASQLSHPIESDREEEF
jgi:hypothetical protein